MCISTGNYDSIVFSSDLRPFNFEFAEMKDPSETVCQRKSSETTQQNFLKLCSNEGHNV